MSKADRTPLEEAEHKISNAKWAALFSAGVTMIFAFVSLGGEPIAGIDAAAFIDVALIVGLAFGISQKSRTCAVILLIYFVASKLMMWKEAGNVRGLPVALVFMWYFFQGVIGTFDYHSLVAGGAQPRAAAYAADAAYAPAGGSKSATPWLVWMILASILVAAAGAGWYMTAQRRMQTPAEARKHTHDDIHSAAAAAVGRLNRIEMSGAVSPIAAAIAVDDGLMLVPCRGITPGAQLVVNIAQRDIRATLEAADDGSGICKLAVKDVGAYPLKMASVKPKVGDAVFAATFNPNGELLISAGAVQKLEGAVIESTARTAPPLEGTPLLDGDGRVVAIAMDGKDKTLPAAFLVPAAAR